MVSLTYMVNLKSVCRELFQLFGGSKALRGLRVDFFNSSEILVMALFLERNFLRLLQLTIYVFYDFV